MRSIVAISLAGLLVLSAQQAPPPGPQTPASVPKGTFKFESTVQLVVVDVTAKDKNGKPIEGLTEKDFTITEDGKPQDIKIFKFQRLEEEVRPEPALAPRPQPQPVAEDKKPDAPAVK
jgi:hypothetical protein